MTRTCSGLRAKGENRRSVRAALLLLLAACVWSHVCDARELLAGLVSLADASLVISDTGGTGAGPGLPRCCCCARYGSSDRFTWLTKADIAGAARRYQMCHFNIAAAASVRRAGESRPSPTTTTTASSIRAPRTVFPFRARAHAAVPFVSSGFTCVQVTAEARPSRKPTVYLPTVYCELVLLRCDTLFLSGQCGKAGKLYIIYLVQARVILGQRYSLF